MPQKCRAEETSGSTSLREFCKSHKAPGRARRTRRARGSAFGFPAVHDATLAAASYRHHKACTIMHSKRGRRQFQSELLRYSRCSEFPFRSALAMPPMRRIPGQNHLEPPQSDIPSLRPDYLPKPETFVEAQDPFGVRSGGRGCWGRNVIGRLEGLGEALPTKEGGIEKAGLNCANKGSPTLPKLLDDECGMK